MFCHIAKRCVTLFLMCSCMCILGNILRVALRNLSELIQSAQAFSMAFALSPVNRLRFSFVCCAGVLS